jgi:hypothetical protein
MSSPDADPSATEDDAVADDALVVDRIVDGRHAVLLVGPDEIELVIDVARLPAGTKEGDWFRLALTADPELTAARRHDLEQRLAQLRLDRRGGRFSPEG